MKHVCMGSAIAVLLSLAACNSSTSSTAGTPADSTSMAGSAMAKGPSQSEINTRNMKTVYKALETGDVSGMDSIASKDLVDHDGPKGEVKGLDSVKSMIADMHNHVTDPKMDVLACSTDGDYVLTLVRFTGKTKDATMGGPANMAFDDTSVDVVKLSNGKAVEHWGFERPHHMMPPAGKMHKKG